MLLTYFILLSMVAGEIGKAAGVLDVCSHGFGLWFTEETTWGFVVSLVGVFMLIQGAEKCYGTCVTFLGTSLYYMTASAVGWAIGLPCHPGLHYPLFSLFTSAILQYPPCYSIVPFSLLALIAYAAPPVLPPFATAWVLGIVFPPPYGSFGGYIAGVFDPILSPLIGCYLKHSGERGGESRPLLPKS
eukprot:TRINITY_DN21383_c0_g1_i1.p1 TRINITY_DN21383_c0_g1~~TRINITY_DN21383_c0_g1_i1.p1  ORF type:complete len:187 (+),score=15.51 TRINITY_DN21383_c0_g1_i1:49-609(+)